MIVFQTSGKILCSFVKIVLFEPLLTFFILNCIGNAVVHFFLPEVRELYELEKLWTLGPCYDDQYRALLEEDKQMDTAFLGRITDEKGTIGFE